MGDGEGPCGGARYRVRYGWQRGTRRPGSQLSDLLFLPADDPGRGNDWLTAVAGHYAADAWKFEKPRGWSWYSDMVRAANAGSADPIGEADLNKTMRSIWDTEGRHHEQAEPGSDEFEKLVAVQQQRMRVNAEAARRERAEARPERPKMLIGAEFLSMDFGGVLWRVDGLLAEGGNVLLAAQAKAGKTTLRNNLIKSLVDGDPFLGQFKVSPGGVLAVFDLEMPDTMAQDWLRRLKIQHPERFMYVPMLGRGASLDPTDPESVAEWAADLKAAGVTTMLIDCLSPLLAAFGLDEDKPSQVRPLLEGFNTLKRQAEVRETALIHHMGHNGTRARGASSLLDWPDAIWDLTKDEQDRRYLSARGRGVDLSKTALEFDPETLALTLADAPEAEKPELKKALGRFPDLVRQHFARYPAPLSKNKIAEAVGGNKKAVLASVDYLVANDELAYGPKGYGPPTGVLPGL
ncbi:AAA family ATPase [Streptomyces sp. NPDC051642]|uniref:AAA family ATPase n=1 Tax=Streptomyces sp. NPDC051642 TaxID=3154646 RepID=UPI0034249C7D